MSNVINATQPFVDQFDAAKERLPGAQLKWLDAKRLAGIERFAEIGLPTTKTESWKYTAFQT